MSFEIVNDKENILLERRELKCVFPRSAGKITRAEAVKFVSAEIGVPIEKIIPITIKGSTGTTNSEAIFYIYDQLENAKKHLSKHIFMRMNPKEKQKKQKKAVDKAPKKAKEKAVDKVPDKAKEKVGQ